MIRNLKVLGLALAAVFAMSAMAAQAAMASGELFHSDEDPTVITGTGTGFHIFETQENVPVECETTTFTGTQEGKTSKELTVNPTYSNCFTGGVPVTVTSNGCHYVFLSETTEDPHNGKTDGAVEIACTTGHELYFEAAKCKVTVETPQVVHGIFYTNQGLTTSTKDVLVEAEVNTIKYVAENTAGIGFKCGTLGVELGTHDATYEGDATVKGYVDNGETSEHEYEEGAQVGIWWE